MSLLLRGHSLLGKSVCGLRKRKACLVRALRSLDGIWVAARYLQEVVVEIQLALEKTTCVCHGETFQSQSLKEKSFIKEMGRSSFFRASWEVIAAQGAKGVLFTQFRLSNTIEVQKSSNMYMLIFLELCAVYSSNWDPQRNLKIKYKPL